MRQTALNRSEVTLPIAVKCNFTIAYSDLKAKLIAAKYSETADRVQGPAQNILPLRHEAGSIGQKPGKALGRKPCAAPEKALPITAKTAGITPAVFFEPLFILLQPRGVFFAAQKNSPLPRLSLKKD